MLGELDPPLLWVTLLGQEQLLVAPARAAPNSVHHGGLWVAPVARGLLCEPGGGAVLSLHLARRPPPEKSPVLKGGVQWERAIDEEFRPQPSSGTPYSSDPATPFQGKSHWKT